MTKLLFDLKLMRPGCVILQALAKGDTSALYRHFRTADWLTSPTPDMRLVSGTDDEWERVAQRLRLDSSTARRAP